jgi:GPH family glycoside/pentoside/hexuronide:cation symporter
MAVSPSAAEVTLPLVPPDTRLRLGVILDYTAPTVGIGFMFLLVNLYLMKFSTDVLLIAPGAMGLIFGISRIWDAISDPVAGYLSDRTQTRLGRRRPWLLAGTVPIVGVFVLLWSPPSSLEGSALTAWMAVMVFAFYTSMTIFIVPHTSLGAELTDNYHDRTRIFGVRHITWTIGSALALVGMWLLIEASDPRATALRVSLLVGVFTAALLLWAVVRLRERPEYQGRGGTHPYASFHDVFRNPHARLLLIVFGIESLGGATIAILTPYIAQYIVRAPEQTVFFIGTYMLASVIFVPIWLPLSRRFGKKNLWLFAMALTALAFGGMFFLREGSVGLIYVLAFVAGTAASCGAMVGPSIEADVIDYDEYTSGQRKEGAYFAAWNFVFKTATGVTLMLTGFVLQYAGFVPNAEQTETARFWILALYSIFPFVCYGLGALLFTRFSLGEEEHQRIRAELDARGTSEVDPQ